MDCRCINVDGRTYASAGDIQIGETHGCRCLQGLDEDGSLVRLEQCFPLAAHVPLLSKTKDFVNRDFSRDFNISDDVNQVTYSGNFFPATISGLMAVWSTAQACGFTSSPHEHPRATEYILAGPGTTLVVVIAEQEVPATSDKSELYNSEIVGPALTVIPQGLTHYVFNPTCSKTHVYVVLNNADAGRVGMFVPDVCTQPVNKGSPPTKDVVGALLYSACRHRNECRTRCGMGGA